MVWERIKRLVKCSVCFGGVHEATYIKPTGPISGHLMQSVGQLLGYPQHLQEQTIAYRMSTAYDSISSHVCAT